MKKLIISIVSLIVLTSCISKNRYTELEDRYHSLTEENIKLTEEVSKLKTQIDELENGEERLVNLAKNSYNEGKYSLTNKYIKQLKEKHPESKEISYFNRLQPTLNKKIKQELAKREKAIQDSIKLANINNLGIWELGYYVDDFGEPTKEAYISTDLYGTFSNSATTNSNLKVRFLIDKKSIRIQLYEYAGNHPIKGEGFIYFKIRDKNDKEHEIKAYNSDYGNTTVEQEYFYTLKKILLTGGRIKFMAEADKYGSPSIYKFTIENADWLENAITKMNLKNAGK
ncbi:MAG: hypothetical protein KDD21_12235 [Bacteroidetes bacterium]|nr:hypothetical protein [Bacteroidota bacterium]